jgi:hypothetical protein
MDTIRTSENEVAFLEALADTCNVRLACETAHIARSSAYLWRQNDAEFAKRWDKAVLIGAEALEDEAIRRAREGWDEPVYYQGDQCGTVRKYSDTLLIFLLKGAKPEKYRERIDSNVNHSGNLSSLTDEQVEARYKEMVERITQEHITTTLNPGENNG